MGTSVVIVDSRVTDYQTLIDGLSQPTEVLVLNAESDGLSQIATYLQGRSGIDALHIISHGSQGALYLGSTVLNNGNLGYYGAQLASIGGALTSTGDILLYGCNVAQGDVGQAFIEQLAITTRADVAASTDLTGAAGLGGNWGLEAKTGLVEAATVAYMPEVFGGLLPATTPVYQMVNYDLPTFADMAALASAAYTHDGSSLKTKIESLGWKFAVADQVFEPNQQNIFTGIPIDSHAIKATREIDRKMEMVISFEGSTTADNLKDFQTDFVPWGFSAYYKSLQASIEKWIHDAVAGKYDKIYLTGHSLGGAAAQIAMVDMLLPGNLDVWEPNFMSIGSAPLSANDRIHLSDLERDYLKKHLVGVTFGAPSISIDPPGPVPATEGFFLNSEVDNMSSVFKGNLFQFEHKKTGPLNDDPVAVLASGNTTRGDELGTMVAIDLSQAINAEYHTLSSDSTGLALHSVDAYGESLLRALTGNGAIPENGMQGKVLINPSTTYGGELPTLPVTSSYGAEGQSDAVIDAPNGQAYSGNDVLIATSASVKTMNGGFGHDAYIIGSYGIDVAIDGPPGEHLDSLYFSVGGTVTFSMPDNSDALVLTITNPSTLQHSSVTVTHWYTPGGSYQLAQIDRIIVPIDAASYWSLAGANAWGLVTNQMPLFNIGTSGSDTIVGSSLGDTMTGEGGNDDMDGRSGNDSIYGQDGNDTLKGGSGTDSLFGGPGNDELRTSDSGDQLDGGVGNDKYVVNVPSSGAPTYTDITDSAGVDLLEVLALDADPSKTRFTVSNGSLIVEVRGASNQLLTTVTIHNNGDVAAVENFKLYYPGLFSKSYDLQSQLDLARAGISLSNPTAQTDDYPGNASTTGVVAVGGSITGRIETSSDRSDWFQVNLTVGRSYQFDLKGLSSSSGDLVDPYMTLRDSSGVVIKPADTGGVGNDARITYKAESTGLYFVGAGSANLGTGSYTLFATQTSAAPVATNSAPNVIGSAQALGAGTVVAATKLFQAVDSEGDLIVTYAINDAAGSGYFQLNGTRQPEGSSFSVSAAQFANLQFVVGASGSSDTFTVKASDGHLFGPEHSVTVAALAAAVSTPTVLTAQDDTAITTSGNQIVLHVLSNDDARLVRITDLQGAPSYITISAGTQDAIVVNPPDWFTGAFSFSYTATDGKGGTASAKVALTIAQPVATNHAPLVAAIHHTIATNQQDQVEPLLFSSDPDNGDNGLLTIQSYSQPAHGTLTRVGNMLTYAPLTGFVGDDLFSYVIQDPHGAQTTGTVTETVAQALKAVDDVISTNVDSSVAFNVLQNDQYSANSSFFMWAPPYTESKPPHGTVTYGQDGHMQYTPDTGFSGVDTFTYRLTYLGTNTASNTYSTGYVSISVGASGPQGSSGADVLSGTAGSDAIFGNAGDDTLWGGAGNDILDGGAGFDTVSFVGALTGITVNLTQPYANSYGAINWSDPAFWTNDGLGGQDSVRNIEAVIGSEFADVIRGSSSDNLVYGNGGNDSLQLGGGNDTAYGGDGNDTLEVLNLGTVGSYTFFGGNGDDRIFGSTSGDYLDGGSGNDSIDGGGGNDTMYGREGNDRLRGPGTLDGGDGDDVLTVEWNGTGASWLIGGKGNDALGGGNVGNDTLEGGDGNDTLASGAGDDRLDGGNGFDLVDFRGEPAGVIVDLASGFAQTTRGFKSLVSIEAVYGSWNASDRILGSDAAEGLYGDYGNDTLVGRGGHDTISGGTGDDWIEGDGGADLLTGGAGVDRFVYLSTSDFGDVITDFTTGVSGDVLDIASLLASGGYSGSTPGADGYLRFVSNGSDTLIQIDIDGRLTNVSSDTAVTLTGVSANALTAANFSTPVDINALIAAIPVSLRIDVVSTIQKPGIDAPAIYEGNSGTSPLVVHFSREGNLAVPLSAMISFLPGAGLDAADLVGGLPTNTAIVFAAGQSTYDLSLNVVGDTVSEADEQLLIAITSATSINAPSVGIWILTEENLIDGNGVLLGTVGTDEIHSHEKDDTILADSGDDRVASGAGADYVDAGDGNDYVDGGVGSDTLIGGSGTDTLIGGSGDDTYVVDVLTDVVTELTNEGIDTIQTGITYTLATLANVENLTLTGGATINGTGNAANNVLSGNNAANTLSAGAGNDTLDGGLGNDTLVGGAGDDNYVVDAVGDVVTELTNEGTDTIQTTLTTYSLATLVNVENLSYTGAAAFTGTGNATANVITGGAGADTLSGGAGNDSLDGGEGNDQALYSGVQANYTVTRTASGFTVTDEVGSEGTDTLTNIEKLAFANATQTLGTNVDLLAYTWNTHTLLGDVSVSGINQSATTNTGGAATLTAVTDPNVSLTVSRAVRTAEAAATSSAVNLQDAIAILKMIVGLPVNGANQSISPYQTLAADFDGNGSVGLTDAIGVLKHVVGLAAPEPTWHFVNEADTSIPSKTTLSPGTPQTIVTADLSGASPVHVGLVGYLSGDVDGSYAGAAGALDLDVTQPTYIAALVASHPGLTAAQFGG